MRRRRKEFALLIAALALSLAAPAASKKGERSAGTTGSITAVLWREPADIATRDLLEGPGGKAHEPHAPFTFVKEDRKGSSPKFIVHDRDGVKWTVKLGVEARPETAASRLVWAVGYFASEDYFLPELRVEGMPRRLKRGRQFVSPDGVVHNARLKRSPDDLEKTGSWQWRHNPFTGTREFNGLRTMMALMNNWDLKDENNAVYQEKAEGRVTRIYMVSDLGATFGATGLSATRGKSKGNPEVYRRTRFIKRRKPDYVDFNVPTRPNVLMFVLQAPYSFGVFRMRWIGRRIPIADAKWMGRELSRLSPEQIGDAFRAAGYSKQDVETYVQTLESRIAELSDL